MTKFYPVELTGVTDSTLRPPRLANMADVNTKQRSHISSIHLSEHTILIGDTMSLGKRPRGSRYRGHRITCGVTLGATTVAIGVAGTAGKYRAAAVHTAVDTPTDVAIAAQLAAAQLTEDEEMLVTFAAANLPTSDHWLVIESFYSYD